MQEERTTLAVLDRESCGRLGERAPSVNRAGGLPTQAEALDQLLIARFVLVAEVIQQPAALAHHDDQTTALAVILLVTLQMLGQVLDALADESHLHFG